MRAIAYIVIAFVLFTLPLAAQAKVVNPIKVFIFASSDQVRADGFTDPDQKDKLKQRIDSVKDLKFEFRDKKKYQLVEDRADADVSIEVVDRGERPKQGISRTTERLGLVEGGVETRQV